MKTWTQLLDDADYEELIGLVINDRFPPATLERMLLDVQSEEEAYTEEWDELLAEGGLNGLLENYYHLGQLHGAIVTKLNQ